MPKLNEVLPNFIAALQVVGERDKGLIGAVNRDASATKAGVGSSVDMPVVTATEPTDMIPSATTTDVADSDFTKDQMTLSKARSVKIKWVGEEKRTASAHGMFNSTFDKQIRLAYESLLNEVEQDILALSYAKASRAVGTAGTAPFTGTDMSTFADLVKSLNDTGTPKSGRSLVLTSDGSYSLRASQANLFKVDESGDNSLLRTSQFGTVYGFGLSETGARLAHTAGGASGYKISSDTAKGAITAPLSGGSGNFKAGDVVNIDGDSYIVQQDGSSLYIARPGWAHLIKSNKAVTPAGNYSLGGLAFSQDAINLAIRAYDCEDDAATDVKYVTDPKTGITFRIATYGQMYQSFVDIGLVWGVGVANPEHLCALIA